MPIMDSSSRGAQPEGREKMFNVTIVYKSGKVEKTEIPISEYTKALMALTAEIRLVSIQIHGVA